MAATETALNFTDFSLDLARGTEGELGFAAIRITKTLVSGEWVETRAVLPLTSGVVEAVAKRQLRRDPDAQAVFRLRSDAEGEVTITDPEGGQGTVIIPAAKTWALENRDLPLMVEIVWIDSDGKRHPVQSGIIHVKAGTQLTASA